MTAFMWGQVFGVGVFIFEALKMVANEKKKILIINTMANVFYLLQYAVLGAWTGSIAIIATFIRNFVFEKYRQKKKKAPLWFLISILVFLVVVNITTYDGLVSMIPVLMVAIFTISVWQDNISNFKILNLLICLLCMIYDIHYKAYVSFAAQVFIALLGIISLIKYKKSKKKRRK